MSLFKLADTIHSRNLIQMSPHSILCSKIIFSKIITLLQVINKKVLVISLQLYANLKYVGKQMKNFLKLLIGLNFNSLCGDIFFLKKNYFCPVQINK